MAPTAPGGAPASAVTSLSPECRERQWMGQWGEDRLLGRCTFPIGPRNTVSNVAYPLVGLALTRVVPGAPAVAFAVLLTLLGLGSALYHGFKTLWADRLDHAGMFAVFGGLTTYALASTSPLVPVAMMISAAAAVVVFDYVLDVPTDPLLGVFTAAAIIHGTLAGSWVTTISALIVLGAAYGVWHLDRRPDPPTKLVGHACWHVLTALGIGLLFRAQT